MEVLIKDYLGNLNILFPGIDGEELLLKLDEKNICVSTGSACSTGSKLPSHVLTAIGLLPDEAKKSIRFSFGRENTKKQIDFVVKQIKQILIKK